MSLSVICKLRFFACEVALMQESNKSSIIGHLAKSISSACDNKIVFSDPVEKDGIVVIPVAKMSFGFGGGKGTEEDKKGYGGGAGVIAKPIGYIEIKDGETRFVKIPNPLSSPSFILMSSIAGYFLLKGISKIFRR